MNAKAFLDTNVLVYATVTDDPRAAIAMALLEQGGTISVQVLNEFTNTAIRKLKRSWSDVTAALAAFRLLLPSFLPITVAMHEAALEMAQAGPRQLLRRPDRRCGPGGGLFDALNPEDMQHGRVIDWRLTIHKIRSLRSYAKETADRRRQEIAPRLSPNLSPACPDPAPPRANAAAGRSCSHNPVLRRAEN